jgi:hypothetical protein
MAFYLCIRAGKRGAGAGDDPGGSLRREQIEAALVDHL